MNIDLLHGMRMRLRYYLKLLELNLFLNTDLFVSFIFNFWTSSRVWFN